MGFGTISLKLENDGFRRGEAVTLGVYVGLWLRKSVFLMHRNKMGAVQKKNAGTQCAKVMIEIPSST